MNKHGSSEVASKIWIEDNIIFFYGGVIDAVKHRHHAIQVVFSTQDSQCEWTEGKLSGSFIIGSQVEHQVRLKKGWLLLVNPESALGLSLQYLLNNSPVVSINNLVTYVEPIMAESRTAIKPFFEQLKIPLDLSVNIKNITDKRIEKLLENLNLCLLGECQKPASWRAKDIASVLHLSENRFLHLFKKQVGIAWRPYLRWRRLLCASHSIAQGYSATEAAYNAGFSDGAHLSRTFKAMFGVSITEIKALLSAC